MPNLNFAEALYQKEIQKWKKKELKKVCLNLMETAEAVYLSTIGSDGFPYTRICPT